MKAISLTSGLYRGRSADFAFFLRGVMVAMGSCCRGNELDLVLCTMSGSRMTTLHFVLDWSTGGVGRVGVMVGR